MKPVLQYPGSKVRMSKLILQLLGEHGAYVEPYLGSAAVILAKPRVPVETVGDTHDLLIAFYRTLRDRKRDLVDALVHTPYARAEFLLAQEDSRELDDLERARRFMIRVNQAFVGSNGRGTWTTTTRSSSGHSNATKWLNYVTRLNEVGNRLQGVQIDNLDALVLIERAVKAQDARLAMYLDPPYILTTRNGVKYDSDVPDSHHTHMLELATQAVGPTVISGYANSLYESVLEDTHGWARLEIDTASSSGAGKGSTAKRVEVLWANRACAALPRNLSVADSE